MFTVVIFTFSMLSSIKLYNDALFKTDEIDHIIADWLLALELQTGKTMATEFIPDYSFCIGQGCA